MPRSILIVDDDPEDIEIFCSAVKEVDESVDCIGETNAEKVLQKLRFGKIDKPDLIFLDLNMPRINGKQFLSQLKSYHQFADTPVVVYSTSKLNTDREETIRLGAAYFLTKPTRLGDLKKAISRILDGKWKE